MSPNLIGALLMVSSMACFTFNDMFLKLTAGAIPLAQLLAVRSFITCVLLLLARNPMGGMHFDISRRDWVLIALRAICEIVISH